MALFKDNEDNWSRLDWRILQNGWVQLYWKSEVLQADIEWFQKEAYAIASFDCRLWTDKKEMHRHLAEGFQFPEYYGQNLDALNDCVSQLGIPDAGQLVVFQHMDCLDRDTLNVLLDIFAINARRYMLFGQRMIVLVQVDNPMIEIDPTGATPVLWNRAEELNSSRRV